MSEEIVRFGDIAKNISTRVEPSNTKLDIYVGLEHLDPHSLKVKRHGIPDDVSGQKLLVKKGQIIFGKRRAYQRKVAVADWDCICSAHAMVLEANPNFVVPGFLPFFIQSDIFMNRAIAVSEGSLSPTIKWKVLAEQKFLFPNKDMQKRLLKVFNCIERKVNIIQDLLESSKELRKSLRLEVLFKGGMSTKMVKSHWGEIPNGWDVEVLSKIAEVNPRYKVTRDNEVKFCDMAALGTDDYNATGEITSRKPVGSGTNFKSGDLLFARITPCAENGKMAVVDFLLENEIGKGSTEFIVLSPRKISSIYLYHLCRTKRVRQYAINHMEGTTGRQRIPPNVFDEIIVPLAPKDKHAEIDNILDKMEKTHQLIKEKYHQTLTLKQAYLSKVFI